MFGLSQCCEKMVRRRTTTVVTHIDDQAIFSVTHIEKFSLKLQKAGPIHPLNMQITNFLVFPCNQFAVVVLPLVVQQTTDPAVTGWSDHNTPLATFFAYRFHSQFNVTTGSSIQHTG